MTEQGLAKGKKIMKRQLLLVLWGVCIFVVLGVCPPCAQGDEIIIGTGTSSWDFPLYTWYHDARTQTIYLASELGDSCKITGLALYVTQLPGQTMNSFTIRMKHTNLSVYSSPSWESSGWTTVFQTNETITTTGWVQFGFTTPFNYNGTQNLMVDISFNNDSYTSSGQCQYSTPGGTRSISYYTDSGYGNDPLAWSGTTPSPSATTYVPNVKLIVESLKPVFRPDGGAYNSERNVLVTCSTPGATIHYTTNGVDPTESDPTIASGGSVLVGVDPPTVLKARAWKTGLEPSGVKEAHYSYSCMNNPSMENFIGGVAEYWAGWTGSSTFSKGLYAHDGAKSQQIGWNGYGWSQFGPGGVYQQISSLEPGRVYRLSAWFKYRFEPQGNGWSDVTCSAGTDPAGGTNPNVVTDWMSVSDSAFGWYEGSWLNVVTFFSPTGPAVTIFIKAEGYGYAEMEPMQASWGAYGYIDNVTIDTVETGDGGIVEATSPVPANGANDSTVTITVVDTVGNPIPGIPASEIIVNCTGSGNTIIEPDTATDTNGQTTAKIKSTVAETKVVSVTVLGTLLSDTATVEFGDAYWGPVWYVDASNTGYGNGSPEHPFRTISDAIIPAQDGGTIIVSPGTYYENDNFSGKEITLRSTNPNSRAVVEATIIDANGSGSAVSFSSDEGSCSVLSGFTITHGNAYNGGGIYCSFNASPIVTNNIITGNMSSYGGGVYGGKPKLQNNIISNNHANYSGAGIYSGQGKITSCLITNNAITSAGNGGGIGNYSGVIANCTIAANSAGSSGYGGGLYSCNGPIKNCIIWGNTAVSGGQLYSSSEPTYSCIQGWTGGGIGNRSDDPLFADAGNGDYHLRSQAGRWDPLTSGWVIDGGTSLCIDGGDPLTPIGVERNPNGGRINMGFYGGTSEASKSTSGIVQPVCIEYTPMDLNKDCKVDLQDFALFAQGWLDCHIDPQSACL
jgi:hypothetical protein